MAAATDTIRVSVADLREIEHTRLLVFRWLTTNARLYQGDKTFLHAQLKRIQSATQRYLQFSLFSPSQRE